MKSLSSIIASTLALSLVTGCSSSSPFDTNRAISRAKQIENPEAVHHNMNRTLRDFGSMIQAYTSQDKGMVVEVDLIPNDSGVFKELPKDLGFYAVHALSEMDAGFQVQRAFESNIVMDNVAAQAFQRQRKPASVVIKGQLLRNSERVISTREKKAGAQGKIEGLETEFEAGKKDSATIKNLRIGLYLENAAGTSLPGFPTAIYDVWYRTDTNTANVSLFFAGNGMSGSREMQVNQDVGDAVLDATAACVMQLMGYLFKVPYYRCAPDMFPQDERLVHQLQQQLSQETRAGLLADAKNIMIANGAKLDRNSDAPTDSDMIAIEAALSKAGLKASSDSDLVKFYISQWQGLDYRNGARLTERHLASTVKSARQQQEVAAREASSRQQAVPTGPGPETFGWQPGTPFVAIDMRRVPDRATQEKIIAAARGVPGSRDVRYADGQGLCGVNFSGTPGDLQRALRKLNLNYNYVWVNKEWTSMIVVPLQTR